MSKLNDLINKRGKVADQINAMRKHIDDNWTDENDAAFNKLSDEYEELTSKIEKVEKMDSIEAQQNSFNPVDKPEITETKNQSPFSCPAYEAAFENMVRTKGADISNELSVGTDGKGGFTVPESWAKQLDRFRYDQTVMRQVATVRTYKTDENMPQTTGGGSAARLGEGVSYPTGDMNFANKVLKSHKSGSIVLISDELLQDSLYNIQTEVGEEYGSVFGQLDEVQFTTGDGTGTNSSGFLTTAANALTAASATAITLDELIDLQDSLRAVYAANGRFMMNKNTLSAIRKLKDSDGRYLWQPSVQAGEPPLLLGSPYSINEQMPDMATGEKAIAFGDFSQYVIGDRLGLSLKVLDERYADDGKVGMRFTTRNDGLLKRSEAVKTITMA